MSARWVRSVSAVLLAGLTVSAGATAQDYRDHNAGQRERMEYRQVRDDGRDGRNGRSDRSRYDRHDRRGDGYRGGPRFDRYDDRHNDYWRRQSWRWNGPTYIWGPPRRVYAPPYYYRSRVDAWDVLVWGVLPIIVYESLTANARVNHQYAYNQAMRAPVGETVIWNDANANGTVKTLRDGYAGDKYCREFQQTITVDGREEDGFGTACQEPDGSWRLVPQK